MGSRGYEGRKEELEREGNGENVTNVWMRNAVKFCCLNAQTYVSPESFWPDNRSGWKQNGQKTVALPTPGHNQYLLVT
jgi:hypothetical protein